jgi:hypothetical protein
MTVYSIHHILFQDAVIGADTGQHKTLFVLTNLAMVFFQGIGDFVHDLDHPWSMRIASRFSRIDHHGRPRKLAQSKLYRQTRGKHAPLQEFHR